MTWTDLVQIRRSVFLGFCVLCHFCTCKGGCTSLINLIYFFLNKDMNGICFQHGRDHEELTRGKRENQRE
jgi:hypothetical protein